MTQDHLLERARRRPGPVAWFLLAFSLCLSYSLFVESDSLYLPTLLPFLDSSPSSLNFSAIDNYEDGRWQALSEPIDSLSSLAALYPGVGFSNASCGGGLDRLFRIASWEWVGEDGAAVGWEGRRFLVDALRRAGGLFFVGDSITRMHFEASNFLLEGLSFQYKEIYTTTQPLFVYKVLETIIKNPSHAVLTLNPLHPAVEDLLQEAGVGKERIDAPVLSMFRSDFLGSDRESIDTACAENGVAFNWEQKVIFSFDWLSVLKNYTRIESPSRTLVVLNTGPHWGVSPFKDPRAPLELVLGTIKSIVRGVFSSLAVLPNIEVVVRTGYPGQRDCINFTTPFEDVASANTNMYGWDRIPMINEILRENMGVLYPTPSLLLDVERQGTMRGDARLKPDVNGGDCLHMCPTAIAEDWSKWIGMAMKQEEGWGT
ncbi:hypothetical protein BDY24DRAFT_402044 [Mrakia frigida]|uniref:uncharacterized protein n=1 Tax=Mrakia frigida TaxID=29902 RepID=UPI003FCC0CF5